MSWQRLALQKSITAPANRILVHDIGAYLERCYLGQNPTLNRRPFISIRTIAADPEAIHYELASMTATAQSLERSFGQNLIVKDPVYQSFWVKDVERLRKPLQNPVVMSRTWLQPRPYDSLYWISLFQVFDDAHDRDKITEVAVSRWYPNEAELEKEAKLR
jgi:hypothetical protein